MSLNREEKAVVGSKVQEMLGRSPAFRALPAAERAKIFRSTAQVVDQMVQGELSRATHLRRGRDPYAIPLDDPTTSTAPGGLTPLPPLPDNPNAPGGSGTTSGAPAFGEGVTKGVTEAGHMVKAVDFPGFCAALIEGVFHSIVKSSIEQMKAYAELVQSVAQSLSDFKDQNTTANQARDHLVGKYPNLMQINVNNGQPTVGPKAGADMLDMLPNFKQDLGITDDVTSLDSDTIENVLVPAAQMDLARGRQKLLATTILMGINRIVVTDGKINAKLRFQFSASDQKTVNDQATQYDHGFGDSYTDQGQYNQGSTNPTAASGDTPASGGSYYATGQWAKTQSPTIAVSDQTDTQSQSMIQAGGSISGEVNINFKSDVVPLEKLIDTDQIQMLNAAQSAGRGAPAAASSSAAPSTSPAASTTPAAAPPATAPAAAPAPAAP